MQFHCWTCKLNFVVEINKLLSTDDKYFYLSRVIYRPRISSEKYAESQCDDVRIYTTYTVNSVEYRRCGN